MSETTAANRDIPERGRLRRWAMAVAVVLALVGIAYVGSRNGQRSAAAADRAAGGTGPAVSVVAARARIDDVDVHLTGLGTVTALKTVTVRARVDGELVTVAFREGQLVGAGDLLAEIDSRPFQVQLEQAEGQKAKDEAALADAQLDLQRYQVLIDQDAVPRQQLDTQRAAVKQLEAALRSDQAQIDTARLNLTYARITAPASGRIGLRLVDPGNIIHATDATGLAVITQRQPIAVVFTLPQDQLPEVLQQLRGRGELAVDAYDRDLTTKLASGTLAAVDSQIDPTTGTIKLKATFPNGDEALFPNQFVNARLRVKRIPRAVVVPSAALQRGPQQTFVYVVTADQTVESREVVATLTEGDEAVIAKGVAAGEMVVTDGVDRLKTGTRVAVRE